MEIKNVIIGYANKKNRNKSFLSKKELKDCIKDKKYIPIVDNFNMKKLIGMTSDVRIKNNKIIIDGFLLRKRNLKSKSFAYGIFANTETLKNKKDYDYKLINCSLSVVGLIDKENDIYNW